MPLRCSSSSRIVIVEALGKFGTNRASESSSLSAPRSTSCITDTAVKAS
jgi:hypothetical protein